MTRREQFKLHEQYIREEGLDKLIDFQENMEVERGVFDPVSGTVKAPIPPEPDDLVRLHKCIRQRKVFTVLEFGVGYSTIIMADALFKNRNEWNQLEEKPKIRNRFMFRLFSVDASQYYIDLTKKNIPAHLADIVHFHHSEVEIGTYCGQLCHYYKSLPDIVPDFVYLDGPAGKDVKGTINGLSFQCDERTVMSGDLLLMEPTLIPGTLIIIDGRKNNARFLKNNFKRNWRITEDKNADVTFMELWEPPLGAINRETILYCLGDENYGN